MSKTLPHVRELVATADVKVSDHGYDELSQGGLAVSRRTTKLIREGDYIAEVEVELTHSPDGWGPYLSLADARKLGDVRA